MRSCVITMNKLATFIATFELLSHFYFL